MSETISPPIEGLFPRAALLAQQREEMHVLLSRYFEGVTREQFERDLAEKNWVVEIRRDGRLVGFSTLLVCLREHEGREVTVIYSGDTIVAPEAWQSPVLARRWISSVNYLRSVNPTQECYWLLLTSGFRTYRFLPVFWREFYPRFDAATPAREQSLLDHFARLHYRECFDAERGIVRFPRPQRLRGWLRQLPTGRADDPHVSFFLGRNPDHGEGHELVCITEITESNLTAAGRRMVTG